MNKEEIKKKRKEYYIANKEKWDAYRKEHKDEINERRRLNRKKRVNETV